jgi:hypothetical protein
MMQVIVGTFETNRRKKTQSVVADDETLCPAFPFPDEGSLPNSRSFYREALANTERPAKGKVQNSATQHKSSEKEHKGDKP